MIYRINIPNGDHFYNNDDTGLSQKNLKKNFFAEEIPLQSGTLEIGKYFVDCSTKWKVQC